MQFTDRSRVELDWTCARARYHGYEWEGIGLAPIETPKELAFGLAMAEQTANIKLHGKWSLDAFTGEPKLVAEALLLGYALIVWPRWTRDYDLVSAEEELPLELTPWLTYNTRPDTIMRRKRDGTLWYGPEDKTTAWLDSLLNYAGAIQLHATALAIEKHKGERVAGCLVQGLYKGFEKEGKLYHPLIYAYVKEGRAGIVPDQWSAKWVRGWERAPTSQYPGGMKAWILAQSPEVIAGVFPNSEPVTIKRPLVESYLQQVVIREKEIAEWRVTGDHSSEALAKVFPQSFNQCDGFSKGRKACPWHSLCYSETARKFPLTLFKKRVAHHPEGEVGE